MDTETQKIHSDGESISEYVNRRGWKQVKEKFTNKILDLQSIKNLSAATGDALVTEIKIRTAVVDILLEIIKEVEGDAQQYEGNKPMIDNIITQS